MTLNRSQQKEESYSNEVLKNLKTKVKAFVFDVDGTIKSSSEPDCSPLELIEKILSSGKFIGIITASGVSAIEGLAKPIVKLILKNNYLNPVYFGVANGVALYRLDRKGCNEVYYYSLKISEVRNILRAWQTVIKGNNFKESDLVEKGLTTFNDFLKKDWGEYIPNDYLAASRKFKGECFVEKLKATFVMPKNDVFPQKKFVQAVQAALDRNMGKSKYIVEAGDTTFAHVTRRPGMTPKLFALKKIIKELKLTNEQIAVFGDMPNGNDKGLLFESRLPYTFTNSFVDKPKVETPPFILLGSEQAPVRSVYQAVGFLLK